MKLSQALFSARYAIAQYLSFPWSKLDFTSGLLYFLFFLPKRVFPQEVFMDAPFLSFMYQPKCHFLRDLLYHVPSSLYVLPWFYCLYITKNYLQWFYSFTCINVFSCVPQLRCNLWYIVRHIIKSRMDKHLRVVYYVPVTILVKGEWHWIKYWSQLMTFQASFEERYVIKNNHNTIW